MINISFNGTDKQDISTFETKQQKVLAKLADRFTLSMQRLQEKAREKAAGPYSEGALEDSIQAQPARIEGSTIIGNILWGEGIPYARTQELGSVDPRPAVNPLGQATGETGAGKLKGGTVKKILGLDGKFRRQRVFGKDVLHFLVGGTEVFSAYAFPGPIRAKHFMQHAMQESQAEIRKGIMEILEINTVE